MSRSKNVLGVIPWLDHGRHYKARYIELFIHVFFYWIPWTSHGMTPIPKLTPMCFRRNDTAP
ncbi:MAG: hypothetical protein ACRYE8_04340 [Janthinobacterium lividum]